MSRPIFIGLAMVIGLLTSPVISMAQPHPRDSKAEDLTIRFDTIYRDFIGLRQDAPPLLVEHFSIAAAQCDRLLISLDLMKSLPSRDKRLRCAEHTTQWLSAQGDTNGLRKFADFERDAAIQDIGRLALVHTQAVALPFVDGERHLSAIRDDYTRLEAAIIAARTTRIAKQLTKAQAYCEFAMGLLNRILALESKEAVVLRNVPSQKVEMSTQASALCSRLVVELYGCRSEAAAINVLENVDWVYDRRSALLGIADIEARRGDWRKSLECNDRVDDDHFRTILNGSVVRALVDSQKQVDAVQCALELGDPDLIRMVKRAVSHGLSAPSVRNLVQGEPLDFSGMLLAEAAQHALDDSRQQDALALARKSLTDLERHAEMSPVSSTLEMESLCLVARVMKVSEAGDESRAVLANAFTRGLSIRSIADPPGFDGASRLQSLLQIAETAADCGYSATSDAVLRRAWDECHGQPEFQILCARAMGRCSRLPLIHELTKEVSPQALRGELLYAAYYEVATRSDIDIASLVAELHPSVVQMYARVGHLCGESTKRLRKQVRDPKS